MSDVITKEMLEAKLALYQTELQQLLKLQDVYRGGIQVCEQLLNELAANSDSN